MFQTLIESRARHPRRRAGLAASVALHTVVIAGALTATASARSRAPVDRNPNPTIIFTQPRTTAEPTPRQEPLRRTGVAGTGVYRLPPIAHRINFAVDSLFPRSIDIDPQRVLPIDTGAICLSCGMQRRQDPTSNNDGGAPATLATVDKAASLVSPPRPEYPETLRRAGVVGRVVLRLVVDTLGRVERGSVVIRESSHELFAEAVDAALSTLRFVPAEAGGRKVRMLVDLPFEFRLNR